MKEPAQLLEQALDGNLRAQNQLFDQFLPMVLAWAHRLGGPRLDASDTAQEVFIVVLTRLETLQDHEKFQSWLYGITRRVIAKHRRRAWLRKWVGEPKMDVADERLQPDAEYGRSEFSSRVQSVLEAMSAKQREVLVLCDLEERTNPEVSEMLGIPTGTVASRLRLARAKFKELAKAERLDAILVGGVA